MLIVALTLSPLGFAAPPDGKGKGGGGGGEDPPSLPEGLAVRYQLTWLDENGVPESWPVDCLIYPRDISSSGTVVGRAELGDSDRAFCYVGGVLMDLNDLPATWVEYGDDAETLSGWIATRAEGINESGQIVGTAQHQTTLDERVFLLHYPDGLAQFALLPMVGSGLNRGKDINDLGVVVGEDLVWGEKSEAVVYTPWSNYGGEPLGMGIDTVASINNSGEIIGRKGTYIAPDENYIYTPGAFTQYEGRWFYGINNLGQISGSRDGIGKGKSAEPGATIRLNPDGSEDDLMSPGGLSDIAWGINDAGDVTFRNGDTYLWTDEFGALSLSDLIVNSDVDWNGSSAVPWAIANPNATDFGQICGWISYGRAFILTPFIPEN